MSHPSISGAFYDRWPEEVAYDLWEGMHDGHITEAAYYANWLARYPDPSIVIEACNAAAKNFGEPTDHLLDTMAHTAAGDPFLSSNIKHAADKLAIRIQAADGLSSSRKQLKVVTGIKAGYCTWRFGSRFGLVIMPMTSGVLLEGRCLPLPSQYWPSRSIHEPFLDRAYEATDDFSLVATRLPTAQFVGFQCGKWEYSYTASHSTSALRGGGRFILLPYWSLLLWTSIAPVWALKGWVTRITRFRHQKCVGCAFDLRASSIRCPECGLHFRGRG